MAGSDEDAGQGLLENLLNLEINTITRPGITGRKMPPPAVALVEISEVYEVALTTSLLQRNATIALAPPPPVTPNNKPSAATFQNLAHSARDSSRNGNPALDDIAGGGAQEGRPEGQVANSRRTTGPAAAPDAVIYRRIAGNCERLREILCRDDVKVPLETWSPAPGAPVPDLPLAPEELVLIRKIWELGVEPVTIQTVIQADGDILTRSTSRAAAPEGGAIRDVHLAMVTMSVQYWQFLVQVALQLVETAFFFRSSDRRSRR